MAIRLSGMVSGLDTDSIVQNLSSVYQVKIDNVKKKKKKTEWQMEEWSTLNSKIYSMYTGTLSKLKTYGNYKTKSATVSGAVKTGVKVTASNNASAGTYSMKVLSSASAAFITGENVSGKKYTATYNAGNATTFKEMYKDGVSLGDTLNGKSIQITGTVKEQEKDVAGEALYTLQKKNADGTYSAVDIPLYDADGNVTGSPVTKATKSQIDAFLAQESKNAGYNAEDYKTEAVMHNVDKDFTYTFTDASSVTDINQKLKEAGVSGIEASMKNGVFSFVNTAGYSTNEDGSLKEANGTFKVSSADGALTALGYASDNDNDVNVVEKTEIKDGNTTYSFDTANAAQSAYTYKVADTSLSNSTKMSDYFSDLFAAAGTNADGKKVLSFDLKLGTGADAVSKKIEILEDDTIESFSKKITEASGGKINAAFDNTNQRFFLSSSATGEKNNFSLTEDQTQGSADVLSRLGLTGSGVSSQAAKDAKIVLNGAELTSSTNNIKVDALGLDITVESAPKVNSDSDPDNDEEVSITVGNDTKAVYNIIKDFVKEYNELVTTMSSYYYAKSSSYEPLTEDEEAQMTDKQVDKWETEAKASLLRRDSTLENIMSAMRTQLAGTVAVENADGTTSKLALSSFGVCTGDWNEYGKLHIYGDSDDALYAGKDNKLMKAIEEDPDSVMKTFGQIGQNLYDKLFNMFKKTSMKSSQKLYNNTTMEKQITDYEDEIDKLQDKLEEMQDKYYKQFTAMEKSLSKLNSTASSLGFTTSS